MTANNSIRKQKPLSMNARYSANPSQPFDRDFHMMASLFDDLFDSVSGLYPSRIKLADTGGYPPYDWYVDTETAEAFIEVAVAGFTKEELEVVLENKILSIKGKAKGDTPETIKYFSQKIARRAFELTFQLGDYKIDDVTLEDGILKIKAILDIPEEKKPRQLEIR